MQSIEIVDNKPNGSSSPGMEAIMTQDSIKSCQLVSEDFSEIPVIDLDKYMKAQEALKQGLTLTEDALQECTKVAQCFHNFGILLVKDPRVDMRENEAYIDLMEEYFAKTGEAFYRGEQIDDIKKEHFYQVGATPEYIEMARCHREKLQSLNLSAENTPVSPLDPVYDAKWRFFWKIGERPEGASDDFPQVIPTAFPDWEQKMNSWGTTLHTTLNTVAEMAALGMGLETDAFTQRMQGGAHLLAPTGSDLEKNDIGAIFAGFHYDISLMTIHGKSRYPGLYVWTRNWQKKAVKIPEGCLLIQAGRTFEHITGGYVLAGFHEVVYSQATKDAVERRRIINQQNGIERTQWRVSSTMFCHFRGDVNITPLPELAHLYSPEQAKKYPRMTAFDHLMTELNATGMAVDSE